MRQLFCCAWKINIKNMQIYPKVRLDCEKVPFAEEGIVICMRF